MLSYGIMSADNSLGRLQTIETRVNQDFKIPPPSNDPALYESTLSRILVADYGLRVMLPGNGVVEGGIQIYKDPHFHTPRRDGLRRTPLGEIRVTTIIDGDKREVDPATLPYQVEVQLYDLQEPAIQSTRIHLNTFHPERGRMLFDGNPRVVNPERDSVEIAGDNDQFLDEGLLPEDTFLDRDERASLYVRTWVGPGSGDRCIPYLPPTQESFTKGVSLFIHMPPRLLRA